MKKLKLIPILLFLGSCGADSGNVVNSDEVHRQTDWNTQIEGVLQLDTLDNEWNQSDFIEVKSTSSIQQLSDQLFELAFTGDVEVYAPDVFGTIDRETKLNPEELVDELKAFDTTSIEDLNTGNLRDTVIDLSFTKEQVSVLRIYCDIDAENGLLDPKYVGLGSLVFDEITGKLRGISSKFYIGVSDDSNLGNASESIVFQSDSLGVFRPTGFMMYGEDTQISIKDMALSKGANDQANCSFSIELDNRAGRLYIEDLSLSPIEKAL